MDRCPLPAAVGDESPLAMMMMMMRAAIPGATPTAEVHRGIAHTSRPHGRSDVCSAVHTPVITRLAPSRSRTLSEIPPARLGALTATPCQSLQRDALEFSACPQPCNRTSLKV